MSMDPGKRKRKNEDLPRFSIIKMMTGFLRGIWRYGVVVPAAGLWWLAKGTWHITKDAFRLTKHAFRYGFAGSVWAAKAPFRALRWFLGLFRDIPPEFENARQAAAYRRIKRYYRRRKRILVHSLIYISGLFLLLTHIHNIHQIGLSIGRDMGAAISGQVALIVIWTVMLLFHFIQNRMTEAEDMALAEVFEQAPEKRKTAYISEYEEEAYPAAHLSDEYDTGEDEYYYDDESDQLIRTRRN